MVTLMVQLRAASMPNATIDGTIEGPFWANGTIEGPLWGVQKSSHHTKRRYPLGKNNENSWLDVDAVYEFAQCKDAPWFFPLHSCLYFLVCRLLWFLALKGHVRGFLFKSKYHLYHYLMTIDDGLRKISYSIIPELKNSYFTSVK